MSKSTLKHTILTQAIEVAAAAQPKAKDVAAITLAGKEAAILAKYPTCRIVPGSLHQNDPAVDPKYSNKMMVTVTCGTCKEPTRRATSDLFTYKGHCKACLKILDKARKAKAKVDMSQVEVDMETEAEAEV